MPGSLNKVSDRLPATIRDAIAVVQRLGCRYLWIDALCLMQNDADDLDQGVDAMDLIYERAWLTIVAACGRDANARLPGAQDGTRKPSINTHHVTSGITMGVVVGLDDRLGHSIYDTRGWTFQERLLSRRAIYFVDGNLFYRCRRTAQAEHLMDLPNATGPTIWTIPQLLSEVILMHHPVHDYSWIIQFYNKRILTNQGDAPRAMAGIIQRFSVAMRCRFLEGLPTTTFDIFILLRSSRTQAGSVEVVGATAVVVVIVESVAAEDADVSIEDSVEVEDADVSTETVEDAEVSAEDEAVAEEVDESTKLVDSTDVLDSTDEVDDVSTDTVEVLADVVLAADNDT
ncbi:HET domain-containing protein [Fusarium sp. Ph1]|nr:HET domain-containing protein [Fusarium sp. Ph1]